MKILKILIAILTILFVAQAYALTIVEKIEREKTCKELGFIGKDLKTCTRYLDYDCLKEGKRDIKAIEECSIQKTELSKNLKGEVDQTSRSNIKIKALDPEKAVGSPGATQSK